MHKLEHTVEFFHPGILLAAGILKAVQWR